MNRLVHGRVPAALACAAALIWAAACGGAAGGGQPAPPQGATAASQAAQGAANGATANGAAQPASPAPKPAAARPAAPHALTSITLETSWFPNANQLIAYYAQQQGYFKDAGLKVKIISGKGSGLAVQHVAVGRAQFGLADLPTMAQERDQGAPVRSIFVEFPKTPFVFFTAKDIKTVKELKGRTIANSPDSAGTYLLPAALRAVGLTMSDVHVLYTTPSTLNSAFYTGKADAEINDVAVNSPLVDPKRPDNHLPISNLLDVPNIGILSTDAYLKGHAQVARGVVQALGRAMTVLESNPAAVRKICDYIAAHNAGIRSADLQESWKLYTPFLHSPQQQGHPVGWQPPQMWAQTIDILHKYGGVKKDLNPTDYYTNAYMPAS